MNENSILTPEGKIKLEEELKELKNITRKEISEKIELAKEHGDLSENAEYQEARNEQAFAEGRILEIESILKNATVVQNEGGGSVQVGSTVHLEVNGKEVVFTIVGSHEGEPAKGLLSCDSPIGQAILLKKVDDIVEVETPRGLISYKISQVK